MEVIRLNAGNDRNGNPRRVYVVLDGGAILKAYNEGYSGFSSVLEDAAFELAKNAPTFATTPAEYRSILKLYS
jgi:hypothetical protein